MRGGNRRICESFFKAGVSGQISRKKMICSFFFQYFFFPPV
jgi:hypothetical protein